jgi:uncharacterized protein (TIGR03000 family)
MSRPANIAGLEVFVPSPDAEVWLQGQKVTGSGTTRRFYSPPLEPGKDYTYTINAAWHENGELVTQKREVNVRADALARVDFTQARETAERDLPPRESVAPPRDDRPPRGETRTAARPEIDAPPRDRDDPPPLAQPSDKADDREPRKAPPIDGPQAEPARDRQPEPAGAPRDY